MLRILALLLFWGLVHPAHAQPAPAPPAQKKTAAPRGTAKAAEPAGGRCIGVISHIGRLAVQQIGIVVFGNDLKEVPAPEFDDVVVARVRAVVGARATVRKISYASNAFAPYDGPDRPLFRNSDEDLAAVVRSIAQGSRCESYVVVLPVAGKFWNTNQTIKGVGVVTYGERITYLFALTHVRLYDGRSFAVLKKGSGAGTQNPLANMFTTGIGGPSRELKGFSWPPTSATMPMVREGARNLLAESLDKGLSELLR